MFLSADAIGQTGPLPRIVRFIYRLTNTLSAENSTARPRETRAVPLNSR